MNKSDVLAVVANREITRKDVETLLSSLNPQTAMQFRSEAGMKNLVKELVNQELFYLDAIENGLDKEEEFLQEVEKVKANVLKQYALTKTMNSIAVGEQEIAAYYIANKEEFVSAPSVRASHILVDDLEKATAIEEEIGGGLSFEEAAAKYSKCPSGKNGGDLGFFSRGMMVPEFEKQAFELEVGKTSSPVKTQFGHHLIKLLDKREESLTPLDEVREKIANTLMAEKQQGVYDFKVNELRSKYEVKINI